nr:MFS-type transporter clz9-like [Hydra vulgaris]
MVRNYKPKRQKNYNAEIFQAALQTIIDGETISTAAKQFNIPRTTLIDKLRGKHQTHSIGGKTIFFKNQEETLVQRLLYMADRGHTQLTLRIPEGLSRARAEAFNENRVQTFFNDLQPFYEQLDIKNYPNLIYNCDETGLSSVPNVSVKVIALKGSHEVQKLTIGERGTLTTYLATVNAAGNSLPSFFIFKGTKIPDASKFPLGTKVHCSQSGYIDQEIFIAYLHHFNEFCTKVNGKKVLLFLDGHKSHVTIEAIELAIKMDIEIICIPPHSTHRLQPLDTHVNKVVKHMWSEALSNYLAENDDISLPRCNFHIIFNKIWPNILTKRGLIVNAFYHCGLHPLRNPLKDFEYKKAEVFNKATIHQGD